MLYLRAFGGLSLENGGRPIVGAAAQRARLAMLAVLAAAGDRSVARDRLLALFWPDKDAEHARGALRQSLYMLRRDTGEPDFILGSPDLKLNRDVIGCDLIDFDEALKTRNFARAVELYTGPLLDSVALRDVLEVQHWVDGERERRANQFRMALEQLAMQAEEAGEFRVAVELWQRLVSSDPLSATVTLTVMKGLVRAGDRPAALRCARSYERRVRAELDALPDPSVVAWCAEIRKSEEPRPAAYTDGDTTNAPASPANAHAWKRQVGQRESREPASRRVSRAIAASTRPRARLAVMAGAGVVVLSAALVMLRDIREAPGRAAPDYGSTAIAVLPFRNLSVESSQAYFASGLQDELMTQLSKVAGLKVTSRQSVVGYSDTQKSLKQIARELEVGSLVEASVQVVGNRLRVNVQLIDANNDAHVWGERYDRTIDDAFAIQSDVARQIVSAVGSALSNAETRAMATAQTTNAEAYRLYLQGRDYFIRPNKARHHLDIAQQFYERALTLDPSFALGHAALSEVHGLNYLLRYDRSPARAALQREEAETALRLAPDLPHAHLAVGSWYYQSRADYPRALAELRITAEGLPNDAEVWARIGQVTRRMGSWNESVLAHEKTTQLDPRNAALFKELGVTYLLMRRYFLAATAFDRAMALAPDERFPLLLKGVAFVHWQGQLDTLRAVLRTREWNPNAGDWTLHALDLLYWDRQADSMVQISKTARASRFQGQNYFVPAPLYAAWAHQLRGDRPAARRAFHSARVFLDSAIEEHADDERIHAARGLALAGLGRREEALREARWLRQSAAYRKDKFQGGQVMQNRAFILAQVGDVDGALDEIESLLARPSQLSVHTLRLDPRWDPIRTHARFRALLVKYGTRSASHQ